MSSGTMVGAVIDLATEIGQRQAADAPLSPDEARALARALALTLGLSPSETWRLVLVAAALTETLPDIVLDLVATR